jgi:hypothetical protein
MAKMLRFSLEIVGVILIFLCYVTEGIPPSPVPSDPLPLSFDFSKYPECNVKSDEAQIPVPKLARKVTIKGEAKMKLEGIYVDTFILVHSEEYFDYDRKQGANILYASGGKSIALYDFASDRLHVTRQHPEEIECLTDFLNIER